LYLIFRFQYKILRLAANSEDCFFKTAIPWFNIATVFRVAICHREVTSDPMTSFFEHQRTSFKRNYIRNLIALASSDGNLDPEERNLIQTIGQRRGLKEWQIAELLADETKHEFFIPDTVGNRMNLLYDVMQIVYADGKVTRNEITFVSNILNALMLEPEIVQDLLNLFESHTPSTTDWNDFIESVADIESKKFVTIL
jgi:uncharacterized tellurite resistance protein B-like protein